MPPLLELVLNFFWCDALQVTKATPSQKVKSMKSRIGEGGIVGPDPADLSATIPRAVILCAAVLSAVAG